MRNIAIFCSVAKPDIYFTRHYKLLRRKLEMRRRIFDIEEDKYYLGKHKKYPYGEYVAHQMSR